MENQKPKNDISPEGGKKNETQKEEKSIFDLFDPDELEGDDEGIEGDIQSDGF